MYVLDGERVDSAWAAGSFRKSQMRMVSSCELLTIWNSSNWSRKTLPECSWNASGRHSMLLCKLTAIWDGAGKMNLGLILVLHQFVSKLHMTHCASPSQSINYTLSQGKGFAISEYLTCRKFILQLSHYSLNPDIRHTLCRTNQTPSPHNSGAADTCTVFLIPWQNSFLKLQHSQVQQVTG